MKKLMLIAALALGAVMPLKAVQRIIPAPAVQTVDEGKSFALPAVLGVKSADSKAAKTAVKYINDAGLKAKAGSNGAVTVKIDKSLAEEAYKLNVTPSGIEIVANGNKGIYYAVQSLSQLALGNDKIECVAIDDAPRFGYRGLMLDVVRYYMPPAEVKKLIDMAARLKLNNVHLHLTDDNGWRLQIKKYPKLTEVGAWRVARPEYFPGRLNARSADEPTDEGGFYTQAQMRDIVKYAAERHINIIPEIEMPAHAAAAIASYPELTCPTVDKFVGVFPGIGGKDAAIIMCAGNEKTYQFLTDVLDEVMDIFPSEYIHLGGDEANKREWEKCPLCNKKIADEHLDGHEGLQAYLMDRINHYVRSKGRKAIGWDEVTYGNPQEEMTIMGWQGDGGIAVRDSKKYGREFILTPAKTFYLIRYQGPQWFEPFTYFGNNTLEDCYKYEPVGADWDAELRSHLKGVQGSLWCEFCRNDNDVEYLIFPRLLAVADVAWRPEGQQNWPDFLSAVDAFTANIMWPRGINYARSMYNLGHTVKADGAGGLTAQLACIRPDVKIRYSVGDSTMLKPYTQPISVKGPAKVYAATFCDSAQMGRTLCLPLNFNEATGKKVNTATCRNSLQHALTNGLRGSEKNSDGEWAGWWNETAEFVVDLGEKKDLNAVKLGTLFHSDICTSGPRHVYLYSSADGRSFTLDNHIELTDDEIYHKQALIRDLNLGKPAPQARYLKVVAINPGCIPDGYAREGAATWMYFDELIAE